jgi:hypothetical protein
VFGQVSTFPDAAQIHSMTITKIGNITMAGTLTASTGNQMIVAA